MKLLLMFAAAIHAVSPTVLPRPHSAWKYQRSITPVSSAPEAEQCVVLDADTFAHAEPGLRDLRLLQDGREIPYALDESHDEAFDSASLSGLDSKDGLSGNRAQYETALELYFSPPPEDAEFMKGSIPPPGVLGNLPAHVPVERIRVDPPPTAPVELRLRAAPDDDRANGEQLDTWLNAGQATVAFTFGANLQKPAFVVADVRGFEQHPAHLLLEMRRRELCFQPLSHAPLMLLLGNEAARPVRYEYARAFHPNPAPLLGSLGPIQTNPEYRLNAVRNIRLPTLDQLLLAIFAASILTIAVSAHSHKRRTR